ncbi:MAG: hypothetical protein MZW92_69670 [Comamonadaceae bacterium]|nr:hypothetical protein [Comamonadaceae bacterium]
MMTSDPVAVRPKDTVQRAAQLMDELNVGRACRSARTSRCAASSPTATSPCARSPPGSTRPRPRSPR